MPIQQLNKQFNDLLILIGNLGQEYYTNKSMMLGGVSIGQHVRHILEMTQCLVQGYSIGIVNYHARKRDVRIEADPLFAIKQIEDLKNEVLLENKQLELWSDGIRSSAITTFYFREVVYNTEHALHHMALIRVALREMELDMVDEYFGVAPSTVQYQQTKNVNDWKIKQSE